MEVEILQIDYLHVLSYTQNTRLSPQLSWRKACSAAHSRKEGRASREKYKLPGTM